MKTENAALAHNLLLACLWRGFEIQGDEGDGKVRHRLGSVLELSSSLVEFGVRDLKRSWTGLLAVPVKRRRRCKWRARMWRWWRRHRRAAQTDGHDLHFRNHKSKFASGTESLAWLLPLICCVVAIEHFGNVGDKLHHRRHGYCG